MKTKIYATALILILLFISGCRIVKKGTDVPYYETNIHTGGDGLVMEFIENMPPYEVPKGSSFSVGLTLRNIGAHDIENGIIKLKNVYPEYMEVDNDTKRFDLEGRSLYSAEGGFDTKSFKVVNKGLFPNREENTFIFDSFACYPYQTKASAEVCISPITDENFMIGAEESCQIEDFILRGGQGAPVSVTSIETSLIPDFDKGINTYRALFKIEVNNIGGGYVTIVGGYEDVCLGDAVKETKLEDVEVTAFISGQELSCTTPKESEQDPNTITFTCSGTLMNVEVAYTTPLSIVLDYGYVSEDVSTSVAVIDYRIEEECNRAPEHCINEEWYGAKWGVCSPVFGKEIESATQSCDEGKKCCTESKSLCERLRISSGMLYECINKRDCAQGTNVTSYCPGPSHIVCCIRS